MNKQLLVYNIQLQSYYTLQDQLQKRGQEGHLLLFTPQRWAVTLQNMHHFREGNNN